MNLNEIAVSFVMNDRVMGFMNDREVMKMMESCKKPKEDFIILPTKFHIVGYNYHVTNGYSKVEFEILPVDNIKIDDLLK